MLSMTKVEFEFVSDLDFHFFYEKDMRGGVSYNSKKYSKGNNTYLEYYDPKQESEHIIYLESNSLYDYTKSKFFQQTNSNG